MYVPPGRWLSVLSFRFHQVGADNDKVLRDGWQNLKEEGVLVSESPNGGKFNAYLLHKQKISFYFGPFCI